MKTEVMTKEIWRSVKSYSRYKVSNLGRVKRINKFAPDRLLAPSAQGRGGYLGVLLSKENVVHSFRVHRLVLEAFIGPCPLNHQTNHKDGNVHNNELANLEWITPSQNRKHAIETGLIKFHPKWKLKEKEVWLIKRLLARNISRKLISKMFKVTVFTIHDIALKRSWSHIKYE